MLKTTKQITLTGNAVINEQNVMQITATIPSGTGVGSINQYVQNAALYEANKTQIRQDIAEFTSLVYEVEDELAGEVTITE